MALRLTWFSLITLLSLTIIMGIPQVEAANDVILSSIDAAGTTRAISLLSAAVIFGQVLHTLCRGMTPWVVFRFFSKLGIVSV